MYVCMYYVCISTVPGSPQNVKISPFSPNGHNITWEPVDIPNVYYHVSHPTV